MSAPASVEAELASLGLSGLEAVHSNLSAARLAEEAVRRGEGLLAAHGPLVVDTGRYTGRSPNDKFIVKDAATEGKVAWGETNQAMSPESFERLREDMTAHARGKEVFVQDLFVGADPDYRVPVRIITRYAWHSLFARNLFIRPTPAELEDHQPSPSGSFATYTVIDLPDFKADPERHGANSDTVIALNLTEKLVLVGGTEYAGEIKKSIFSIMNFELPGRGVMPMHCSANVGDEGRVALFFGLSGTGKTTLSADPARTLIGDDEHGWSDKGVFNFEGGCYAKVIKLNPQAEPEIYATTRRFGTVLENVVIDPDSREIDLDENAKTENTRSAYPITQLSNASATGVAGHPETVVFLTADAFGVLPPVSKLTPAQAMYHFLSGYTAKVAGTERGVTEPVATFSTCFGAPFMPLPPQRYAEMLGERLERHGAKVWLVNTGWTGGPHGEGERIRLAYTRAMVQAALSGALDEGKTKTHPVFGVEVPLSCPGVPDEVLDARATWRDPAAYDAQAKKLAAMFRENFGAVGDGASSKVKEAAPKG
jgi:phosphoenolpyruvate carboxykinase (ATP)